MAPFGWLLILPVTSERTLTSLRNGTLPERTGDRAVPSSRRPNMDAAEAEAAIVRLAGGGPGPGGGRGRAPRNVWQRLKNEGAFYPRCVSCYPDGGLAELGAARP